MGDNDRTIARRALRLALGLTALCVLLPASALARRHRPTWYPEDLDLQRPGEIETNLRTGFLRSASGTTTILPDLELDVGIDRRLELGVDAQAGWSAQAAAWTALDQLWLSAKHLLADHHSSGRSWAVGVQHGPRLPLMAASNTLGYQAIIMIGVDTQKTQWVCSAGGFLDPMDATRQQPWGALLGLDGSWDLSDRWTLEPGVSATAQYGHGTDVLATLDIALNVAQWLIVRAGGSAGRLDGSRALGLQVGLSPLWSPAKPAPGRAPLTPKS